MKYSCNCIATQFAQICIATTCILEIGVNFKMQNTFWSQLTLQFTAGLQCELQICAQFGALGRILCSIKSASILSPIKLRCSAHMGLANPAWLWNFLRYGWKRDWEGGQHEPHFWAAQQERLLSTSPAARLFPRLHKHFVFHFVFRCVCVCIWAHKWLGGRCTVGWGL